MPPKTRYRQGSVTFEVNSSRSGHMLTAVKPAGPIIGALVKPNGGVALKLNARVLAGNGQMVLTKEKLIAICDFLFACEELGEGATPAKAFEVDET